MNRFAKMKKERIYTLFETLSIIDKIKAKDVLVFARKFFNTAQCVDLVIKSKY